MWKPKIRKAFRCTCIRRLQGTRQCIAIQNLWPECANAFWDTHSTNCWTWRPWHRMIHKIRQEIKKMLKWVWSHAEDTLYTDSPEKILLLYVVSYIFFNYYVIRLICKASNWIALMNTVANIIKCDRVFSEWRCAQQGCKILFRIRGVFCCCLFLVFSKFSQKV